MMSKLSGTNGRSRITKAASVAFCVALAFGGVVDAAAPKKASSGERELTVVAKEKGNFGALLVGVDKYQTLERLEYASSDVRKLRDALVKIGCPLEAIQTFVSDGGPGERPSREPILAALDKLTEASKPGDTIIVTFSGHGFETEKGDAALCPEDVEASKVDGKTIVKEETAILLKEVAERLRKDDAAFKLLIVDACRNPASMEKGPSEERSFPRISDPNGVAFLQSCETREVSWEHADLNGGVFTHFFAEGLSGAADWDGDGGVSFMDACSYATAHTQRFVRDKRGATQTPCVSFAGVVDFWLKTPNLDPSALPEEYLHESGMKFRLIRPGSFMMGNALTAEEIHQKYPDGKLEQYRDATRHKVTLTKPFYMAQYETTVADFRSFVDATGYKTTAERAGKARAFDKKKGNVGDVDGLSWRNPGFEQESNHPAVCVSWEDAQAYVDWLNANATYSAELGFKPLYRLPTEAEWEYACRAGTDEEFFWGSNEPEGGKDYANGAEWKSWVPFFGGGYKATAPVGRYKPNARQLYDMAGNVWEWCADWYGEYDAGAQTDPTGPKSGERRVLRGGGWDDKAKYCRSAFRGFAEPTSGSVYVGFRVVLDR